MNCVPLSCQDTCVQSCAVRQGPCANSSPIVEGYTGLKVGVGNMGDEYCEETCGDDRGGDKKYPVSQLGAICGVWERTNEEGPGESPACMPVEMAVVTWPKVSSQMKDESMTLTSISESREERPIIL